MSEPLDSPLPQEEEEESSGMPFLDHLEELRWRLLKSLFAIIIMAGAAFYFTAELFEFIIAPLGETQLHFTKITGKFYAHLMVSLVAGLLAALPIIFYQVWTFIAPGLYKEEKMMVLPLVATSTILFLAGAAFCYYITLPIGLEFLIGFGTDEIEPIITVNSYLSFSGLMIIAFGVAFQLPVLSYVLTRLGLLGPQMMAKGRRYALVGILTLGAILTPPDIFTQLLLAGPIYLLYEISIIVSRMAYKPPEEDEGDA